MAANKIKELTALLNTIPAGQLTESAVETYLNILNIEIVDKDTKSSTPVDIITMADINLAAINATKSISGVGNISTPEKFNIQSTISDIQRACRDSRKSLVERYISSLIDSYGEKFTPEASEFVKLASKYSEQMSA